MTEFAEYIARASLDDAPLRTELARAEKAVQLSADKQQAYLNRVGTGAGQAASGLTKFKIAATSAGATIALIDPTIGGVVSRLSAMANALKIVGLSLGTLGLGAAAALVISYRKEISEWAIAQTALGKALKTSNEQLERFQRESADRRSARMVGSDLEAMRDQLAQERGQISKADLAMRNASRAERAGDPFARDKAQVQLDIDSERDSRASRERRDADEESAARDRQEAAAAFQKTIERVLSAERESASVRFGAAKDAAIAAGFASPSDFVRQDTVEGQLMRAMERRDRALSVAGNQGQESGGFGITTRDSGAFRFQRAGGPAVIIGEQREEMRKQTHIQEEILQEFKTSVQRILQQFGFGGMASGSTGLGR